MDSPIPTATEASRAGRAPDPRRTRAGLALVVMILILDVIGIAIVIPVMPAFLAELTGASLSEAAVRGGWLLVIYAGMQFLFAPVLGNLSDRFGRRPVLLASVLTFAIDNLICAFAVSFPMLVIGRLLAGISGGSYATCSAYIADISDDSNRARNFGLVGIAFGVGFTLGPVIGGLLGEFGPRVPFLFAGLLSLANFAVAWFLLPETLLPEHRRAFDWRRANPLGALRAVRGIPGLRGLMAAMTLLWLAHAAYPAVWAYAAAARYGWSEGQIGLSLGVYGITAALVMGLGLPRVVRRLGERRTAVLGLSFAAIALVGYAGAWAGWVVYAVLLATALEAVADPALRSLAAAKAPPSRQGELQGALTSLASLTTVIGPPLFAGVFALFTGPGAPVLLPGAPYWVAAGFAAAALAAFRRTGR